MDRPKWERKSPTVTWPPSGKAAPVLVVEDMVDAHGVERYLLSLFLEISEPLGFTQKIENGKITLKWAAKLDDYKVERVQFKKNNDS